MKKGGGPLTALSFGIAIVLAVAVLFTLSNIGDLGITGKGVVENPEDNDCLWGENYYEHNTLIDVLNDDGEVSYTDPRVLCYNGEWHAAIAPDGEYDGWVNVVGEENITTYSEDDIVGDWAVKVDDDNSGTDWGRLWVEGTNGDESPTDIPSTSTSGPGCYLLNEGSNLDYYIVKDFEGDGEPFDILAGEDENQWYYNATGDTWEQRDIVSNLENKGLSNAAEVVDGLDYVDYPGELSGEIILGNGKQRWTYNTEGNEEWFTHDFVEEYVCLWASDDEDNPCNMDEINDSVRSEGFDYYQTGSFDGGPEKDDFAIGKGPYRWILTSDQNYEDWRVDNLAESWCQSSDDEDNPGCITQIKQEGFDHYYAPDRDGDNIPDGAIVGKRGIVWTRGEDQSGNVAWLTKNLRESCSEYNGECFWPPTIMSDRELSESTERFRGFGENMELMNLTEYDNSGQGDAVDNYLEDNLLCYGGRVYHTYDQTPRLNASNFVNGYHVADVGTIKGDWMVVENDTEPNPFWVKSEGDCATVFDQLSTSFGMDCSSPQFNNVADVNKDGAIDTDDLSLLTINYNNQTWCSEVLEDTSSVCPECETNADCSPGQICDSDENRCISPGASGQNFCENPGEGRPRIPAESRINLATGTSLVQIIFPDMEIESVTFNDNSNRPPQAAIDGDASSYYSACSDEGRTYNEGEIVFDLNNVENITKIDLNFHQKDDSIDDYPTHSPSNYSVLVSEDGSSWERILNRDNGNEPLPDEIIEIDEGKNMRYINISYSKINDGTGWCFGMDEFNLESVSTTTRNVTSYCDPDTLELKPTLSEGESCVSDFECTSNVCIEGECTSVSGEIEEQTNLLQQILDFLRNVFGGGGENN